MCSLVRVDPCPLATGCSAGARLHQPTASIVLPLILCTATRPVGNVTPQNLSHQSCHATSTQNLTPLQISHKGSHCFLNSTIEIPEPLRQPLHNITLHCRKFHLILLEIHHTLSQPQALLTFLKHSRVSSESPSSPLFFKTIRVVAER